VELFPSTLVRNIGVVFDRQKCISDHMCKSVNWLVRNIYRTWTFVNYESYYNDVRAIVLSLQLDYCNMFLNGIPKEKSALAVEIAE
jgi:hypothetical protein